MITKNKLTIIHFCLDVYAVAMEKWLIGMGARQMVLQAGAIVASRILGGPVHSDEVVAVQQREELA